jgi:hypothetical protein
MKAKLVVVAGTTRAQEFKLRLPAILGRGRSCSVQLPHALVSRQHCELFEADGKLRVRDLGSLNGTLVDGQKIAECEVADGQMLNVGTVTFRIEIASDDANGWLAPPSDGGASKSGKNLASRSAIRSATPAATPTAAPSPPAPLADDQLAAESLNTESDDARPAADDLDLLPPTVLPPRAQPPAAVPATGPAAGPAATLPPRAMPTVSPPTVPMAIPGAVLATFPKAGVPMAGVPMAGVPVAGVPMAGIPVASAPMAGVPVAGVPVAGVPVAGVPVAGVPMAGIPVAGVPVAGVPVAGLPVAGVPVAGVPTTGVPTAAPTANPNPSHEKTMDADEDLNEFLKSLRK